MKITTVTVWYNPETLGVNRAIENILSYAPFCERVYIVDNSENNHSELAKKISNSFYISNKNIGGIAGGFNRGLEEALRNNFEYAITMDQDSSFSEGEFSNYLKKIEENLQNSNSFAPKLKYPIVRQKSILKWPKDYIPPSIKDFIKFKILHKVESKKLEPVQKNDFINKCFSSGHAFKLDLWKKIGGFDEDLIIDEVDWDFCNKMALSGERILRFNDCTMNHNLGEQYISLFPKCYYTKSNLRFYYIIRNKYIQKYRYEKLLKIHDYKIEIWEFFRDYCIFNSKALVYLKIFFRAKKDAIKFNREKEK